MKILSLLAAALFAMTLAGCCPGTMLGNSVPRAVEPPVAAAVAPADSDGDGVVDSADRCPNTPKGTSVDASGCPNDSDGDGVIDSRDKCPGTPRGVSVNADGCSAAQLAALTPPPPAPAPSRVEQELAARAEIRLENVYFETGSAKLAPESSAPLNEAGAALAKFPNLKIEVEGHTDARGSEAFNLRLSQARAESVRQYLLDNSKLSPSQVTAKGYGEAGTTLTTDADQLKRDRRVVLRVLNPEVLPKNVDLK
ncbi:MAG: OmpA family protein [Candidatus Eisenbacteria bacterium]|nr:OmpA family protein [Candidatus Eisenbacteria bacterium]